MANVIINNSNYSHSKGKGDTSLSLFPLESALHSTSHPLFKSISLRKLFEGFDLDIVRLSLEQSDLLDKIYLYLLKGGQQDLEDLLPIITKEYQDLWISLRGSRVLIAKYRMKNLFQLDIYLEDSYKRILKQLMDKKCCD